MDVIFIAGLWLPRSIWAETASELERLGHRPISVALPGVDNAATDATLEDQVAAVVDTVDAADTPMVVGHSAACSLAWIAADRRPETIHSVVLIGGFPAGGGEAYADFFEPVDGVMGFPGWEPFDGPDSADLDEATRQDLVANAVPVPEGVSKGIVGLTDDRRFDMAVVAVCPEYTPDQARAWIEGGDVPELEKANQVSFVDIDSGHWPMVTQPAELARILADATTAH